ncbi:hypothetical protein [Nonomuraea sp. NPDC049129]|uniref:hypothetical protein n=1 Tax=Nonomuraea sp. NPDC049129 TaxID=3155272 RepID=UPI0033FEEB94
MTPYSTRGVRAMLTRYAQSAGLTLTMPPHRLGHFLFAWLKTQGIDALIQPYSGHDSRTSLDIYRRLALTGAGALLGAETAHATVPPAPTCGGMTAAAASAAGYTVYEGQSVVNGTSGDDWIYGTALADTLYGAAGDDNADTLYGDETSSGSGAAGDGPDTLLGGNGSDTLYGNGGRDTLRGEANPSTGGDGGDGGNGTDTCTTLEGSPLAPTSGSPISCP